MRLRDEMVAVLSHDLKNPLNVLHLSAAMLRGHVGSDAGAKSTLRLIQRAVDRMNLLVLSLLDLAKIEAGRFDVSPQPYEARRLVSDAFVILAPIAESKGVRLSCIESDAWVDADVERVFQVLSNLIGNAIKFTPSGGAVTIGLRTEEDTVCFEIKDTGPGIDDLELAHIFDRYWQARRVRTAGSGLGLYIAKGIVEAHGGLIWANSTIGAGATFCFTLPATARRDS